MNLWGIVWNNLRQHALSSSITAVSVALAGGLLMAVWVIKDEARQTFTEVSGGFDGVLGARGSKLQILLNAVFHLESSTGNIEWEDYVQAKNHPMVELAVPIAVGDNYRGFRLVGTTLEMFQRSNPDLPAMKIRSPGRMFDPQRQEAVAGFFVARELGLRRGDTFHPYHGLTHTESEQHEETYTVVGVLEPTSTPADRVIWVPIAGIQRMSGHSQEAVDEVSAVLIKLREGSPMAGFQLDMYYNRQGDRLTFAWPIGTVMAGLFEKIGWFDAVLAAVAYLVALIAAASILASIYNSMNERRREIAIMRALGARRWTIFRVIVFEAAAIGGLGALTSYLVFAAIAFTASEVVRVQTGVVLQPWKVHWIFAAAPAGLIVLSALAGVVPAWKAYRTSVAEHLTPLG